MAKADAFAQYMLELVNQFRLDPRGEYGRILVGTSAFDPYTAAALSYFGVDLDRLKTELAHLDPVAPLAWNEDLADAAVGHSQLLQQSDTQSHQVTSLGEASLFTRVTAAGYDAVLVGENVYSYAQSVRHTQDGFIVDWGYGPGGMQAGRGHRVNLMGDYREVGIGVVRDTSPATDVGTYVVTQDFGVRAGAGPFFLGVAYRDRDDDRFYSMGEGLGGLKVNVRGAGQDSTGSAGGYAIEAGEGTQRVILTGSPVDGRIVLELEFGEENVKLDLVDRQHLLTSSDLDLKRGAQSVTVIGCESIDVSGKGGSDELYGNRSRNTLDGEGGADLLVGGGGNDVLVGGGGKDKLRGDGGQDLLEGGRGSDVFAFDSNDGRDLILDWEARDTIRLNGASRSDVDIGRNNGDAIVRFDDTRIVIEGAAGDIDFSDIDFA